MKDKNDVILRKRTGTYDSSGNLISLENYLDGITDPETTFTYDKYGNITRVRGPEGCTRNFTYDTAVGAHITRITDSYRHTSRASYDYRWGLPSATTDLAGNRIRRTYDQYGRTSQVFGPYDRSIPALAFSCFHSESPARAVTKNKESFRSRNADTLDTVIVVDGLARVIQTKVEAEVSPERNGSARYGMTITGTVLFDAFGRSISESQPIFQAGYDTAFSDDLESVLPTLTSYDILDRPILVTLPDGSTIRSTYDIASNRFRTTVLDPENKKTVQFRDARENIVGIDRYVGPLPRRTGYEYSPLGEITGVIDNRKNRTTVVYDTLGRRISLESPNSGLTEFIYDKAGNMIRRITPNLRAENSAVIYKYEYNRLIQIAYPRMQDVTYIYGSPEEGGNAVGRVKEIRDESGSASSPTADSESRPASSAAW